MVDLARFQQLPERYLAKVFTRMKDARLVVGTEGIAGGFALARPAADIRVVEVLDAVDPGRQAVRVRRDPAELRALRRGDRPSGPPRGSCRIDLFMTEAERTLRDFLASKTIADLVCEFDCKAPPEFAAESSGWFQERRAGRTARGAPRTRKTSN